MRKIKALLFGRDARINGLIAFLIVASVALGCTCGDLGELGKQNGSDGTPDRGSVDNSRTSDLPDRDTDTGFDDSDSSAPSKDLVDALVKSTTAQFSSAITTEDFSQMYANSSKEFKNSYTEEKMKEVFKVFIDKKDGVTPILLKAISMDPEYDEDPSFQTRQGYKIIAASGKYATSPLPTRFEYEFIENDGEWKMLKLVVKLQK
jgi:hypothetical protein